MKRFPNNRSAPSAHDQDTGHGGPSTNANAMDGASTQQAAAALSEMALNRQLTPPPSQPALQQAIPRPSSARSLKRARPTSVDLTGSCLQSLVRQQLSETNEDDSTVSSDEINADSFLLRKEDQHSRKCRVPASLRSIDTNKQSKLSVTKEGPSRKRTCAGSNRGARAEARMYERSVSALEQPGMWDDTVL